MRRAIASRLCFRGRRVKVEVCPGEAAYSLVDGPALEIAHYGRRVTVAAVGPDVLPIPNPPARPRPTQPRHRAPGAGAAAVPTSG